MQFILFFWQHEKRGRLTGKPERLRGWKADTGKGGIGLRCRSSFSFPGSSALPPAFPLLGGQVGITAMPLSWAREFCSLQPKSKPRSHQRQANCVRCKALPGMPIPQAQVPLPDCVQGAQSNTRETGYIRLPIILHLIYRDNPQH